MQLDASAEYVVKGDVVLTACYIYDPNTQVFHPEQLKTGTFSLLRNDTVVYTRLFDRRFGTSDGGFHFDVAHPQFPDGLSLKVSVTLMNNDLLEIHIPVRPDNDQSNTEAPLAQQPEVGLANYGITKG